MTYPDFLVIGAQKSGTTTLYEDLREHPRIEVTPKEHASLMGGAGDTNPTPPRRSPRSGSATVRIHGEVSTRYSIAAFGESAAGVAGASGLRIVYIVRDPVERAISHHHHLVHAGEVSRDLATAISEEPAIVENSRYATRLRPWRDALGPDRVLVVKFEDYMASRQLGADNLYRFLGVEDHRLSHPDRAHNTADNRTIATGSWSHLRHSRAYRLVRPLVSERLRRGALRRVLPPSPPRPTTPPDVRATLARRLRPEVAELAAMLGGVPWWDLARHEEAAGGRS